MVEFTRRTLIETSVASAIGSGFVGTASARGDEEWEDPPTGGAPVVKGRIGRLAHTALGAEVTGPFVFDNGEMLFSLQHPSTDNPEPFGTAGVGWLAGHRFEYNGRNDEFEELEPPRTNEEQQRVRVAGAEYELLVRNGDPIEGGSSMWGHPETPDGTPVAEFAGTRYGAFGSNPDMNFLVPTDEDGLEGYLFTNVETSPGSIVRTPIRRSEDGWEVDLDNAMNLENTEAFRNLGGTRINCYGDLAPWGNPISAEEDYVHTRVSGPATVSDIVEAGSGVGLRGARAFFNRPNPSEIQNSLDDLFGEESWSLQGSWALSGLEMLAYHLGAEPVDQVDGENTREPIGNGYPNPYRTGYCVEITEPTADEPTPVKHYTWGRAAWECPEVTPDERTVYLTSDGANKGIYKFVAEEPIPSYDDRTDVRGTLYAIEVTNKQAAMNLPPIAVNLEIDWIELGTATNAEVESWIADYDDVTQVDYLETHAETDWTDDLEAALEEADREVAKHGNRDYVTDEEVVEWAEQYEQYGPDGVDEDLRRVPFLETRAAAKEVGATIEFRKAEGSDTIDDAQPGDYLYVGISELNDGMTDDGGDLRMERVDGGVVYRAELEADYDISRLEPMVVGADAADPASVADDAIINIDNVMVLPDGRVLLCEDNSPLRRSYSNDNLWVYEPPGWGRWPKPGRSRGRSGRSRSRGRSDRDRWWGRDHDR
ncbi:alkaline phosphatase PhoX [Halosolutus gelatinilyticus]|uniref:alkaline phosphatase PhoX n=1 Tax=Halosolutus gelatinilyticus TaxID=2931975 RepID=UPI002AB03525|nr:alkaline phosphatase PhoX [Halosolutus gelatinilyticus]